MTPVIAPAITQREETIDESVRIANAMLVTLGERITNLLFELEAAKTHAGQLRGLLWSAAIEAGGRLDIEVDTLHALSDDCTMLLEAGSTLVSVHARAGEPQAAPEPVGTLH